MFGKLNDMIQSNQEAVKQGFDKANTQIGGHLNELKEKDSSASKAVQGAKDQLKGVHAESASVIDSLHSAIQKEN